MASFDELYADNHKRQQHIVLLMSLAALTVATAPRHERALFITDGAGISAFGAVVPPADSGDVSRIPANFFAPSVPSAFFARRPVGPRGSVVAGPAPVGAGPAAPFGAAGEPVDPAGAGAGTQLAAAGPSAGAPIGGSAFPFSPPSFGGTSTSPAVPTSTTAAVSPVTPVVTPTPTPGGTTTTPSDPVVPAVPEPASWAMLIAGFAIVGMFLRRRTRSRLTAA